MKVIVGCETSGVVREAFRKAGHEAWSCDLEPSEDGSPFHYIDDIRNINFSSFDLGIFHPPCTRLCNSGVRWLEERDLWDEMEQGAELFSFCLNAPISKVAVENPVMHKYAKRCIKGYFKFSQSIQPWEFGDTDSKRTCLWLKGLRILWPTYIRSPENRTDSIFTTSPGKNRSKIRSRTYEGIATAMVKQWGSRI